MNKLKVLLPVVVGFVALWPLAAHAEGTSAFQVSLFDPLQVVSPNTSVDGFRLDVIYGVNQELQGIDIGLVNESQGSAHGFELGADNRVAEDFGGGQFGLFNQVKRDFRGVQIGVIASITGRMCEGLQASIFYNDAGEELHGVQIGIVNHAGSLKGLQIGLVNMDDDQRYKGFMPFVNAAF